MITRKINKIIVVLLILVNTILSNIYCEELYPIKIGKDKYGYINENGELIIPANYSKAYIFEDDIAPVQENNNWSCIDIYGNTLFSLDVDHISAFSEELAIVSIKEPNTPYSRQGYINKSGNFVIEPKYFAVQNFSEGLAVVSFDKESFFFIDKNENDVFKKKFTYASSFSEGYAKVRFLTDDDKIVTTFLCKDGSLLSIPEGFSINADRVSDGYLGLKKNKQCYFWNLTTNEIITVEEGYDTSYVSEKTYSVKNMQTELQGLKKINGQWLIPCIYEYVVAMKDGFVMYQDDGESGFLNESGEIIIQNQFINLFPFIGNLAQFNSRNGFAGGYVSKTGKIFYGKDYIP